MKEALMGMETVMSVIIVGAFGVFFVGVLYADLIASANAITFDQEQAMRQKPEPVKAAPQQQVFKQAA
jgi:purine-nucleoside phosphorylase